MLVFSILECEEHGEFDVDFDMEPPFSSDLIEVYADCPECNKECCGLAPVW